MNDNLKPTIQPTSKIPYFRRAVLQNFPFIEKDFDALTDYELLCKVVEYLNNVITQTNLMEDNENELVRVYNELYNYVKYYFDNLDVQNEINNKLDEMASDGTLQEIIADYLNSKAVFGFDTISDMQSATNLINGSYAQTLGFYQKNDGGGSLYKIRTITNDDVVDNMFIIALNNQNLIAELIVNDIVNFKSLGAYGDNLHDDSTILQNAVNYSVSNNKKLYIDNGEYTINDTININNTIVFECDGTLKTSENITLLKINCDNSIIKINKLIGVGYGTGIYLYNKNYNNSLYINVIQNFEYGLYLNANSNGIQYNKIDFQLLNNTYDIYFIANNTAWINQNEFFGGKCSGGYAVFLDEGTNQTHKYDGNNFYNIGFEELTNDAITLKNASLNSFNNFRMLENITGLCIKAYNNCVKNVFNSISTSLCLYSKIDDACNNIKRCNFYNMNVQNDGLTVGARRFSILNNLPIIEEFIYMDDDRVYLGDGENYETNSNPFTKINLFRVALNKNVSIKLDERYFFPYKNYKTFYVSIASRDGDKNFIVYDNNNNEIFNLSTYTGTTGSYSALLKFENISLSGSIKWSINTIV